MKAKKPLRDVIIVLPGIGGSVLSRDGRDVWAPSPAALANYAMTLGESLGQLQLTGDPGDGAVAADGIVAGAMVSTIHLLPKIGRIDGYTGLQQAIARTFDIVPGGLGKASNYHEMPYDWRRGNRVAAASLAELIRSALRRWRAESGAAGAKAIIVAHSMGGLIARYALEVLECWRECRALVTFGTPYRGSVDALDALANGVRKLGIDLTASFRSFPSVYELLPIYPVVAVDGELRRVAEAEAIGGIDTTLVGRGLEFHRAIESAVSGHLQSDDYVKNRYRMIPVVGIDQPTTSSAAMVDGQVVVSRERPAGVDVAYDGGDGTVPVVSAIPIEASDEAIESCVVERHSSLHNNVYILADVLRRLVHMQGSGLGAVRGPEIRPAAAQRRTVALDVDDVYLEQEPKTLSVRVAPDVTEPPAITIEQIGAPERAIPPFTPLRDGDAWRLSLDMLPRGSYRVEVRTDGAAALPLHDVFVIT